MNSMISAE